MSNNWALAPAPISSSNPQLITYNNRLEEEKVSDDALSDKSKAPDSQKVYD